MSCFCHECAAFKFKHARRCRRASRTAEHRQEKSVAHCMYSDVRLCTSMCPLNQDKKSAVKVYKSMYSIYKCIYFIWKFHTEIYRHTELHCKIYISVYTEIYFWTKVDLRIYGDIRRYTISLNFVLSSTVASYNS